MPKNQYLVLGIASDATAEDIKDAYRRLAKEFHPDHYGESNAPFLEIQEAYSVLSDPTRRQMHDLSMEKKPIQRKRGHRSRTGTYAEPLIPGTDHMVDLGYGQGGSGFAHPFQPVRDLFRGRGDSRFSPRPFAEKRPVSSHFRAEIRLTPEQARQGGQAMIAFRLDRACPSCSGQGRDGGYTCRRCRGEGVVRGQLPLMIAYPAGISDSQRMRLGLDRYGLPGLEIILGFRVRNHR